MKFYTLTNINIDSLKLFLDFEFIQSCNYGSFLDDLIDKNSIIYKEKLDIVFLHLDFEEFVNSNIEINILIELLHQFIKEFKGILIVSNFNKQYYSIDTYQNILIQKEMEYNNKLFEFSKNYQNVVFFDFKSVVSPNFYTSKYWYLGRIKYTNECFDVIAKEIRNIIKAFKGNIKKVLILDLDNTLWGGVIGEEEIKLSNDGIGKIYLDFQKQIKKLKDYGVLLTINSKNNYEDGINGLNHSMSVLKEDDFIIKKINWNNKADNIIEIANELNVGLDSLVFIDDNKIEREILKEILPQVNVAEFPNDIFLLNEWFLKEVVYKFFPKIILTNEDSKKHLQYKAKFERQKLQKVMNYEEFLNSLNIKINILKDDKQFITRYAQLTQKTNQFNLTTKRYDINDIENFINNPGFVVLGVEYEDKFLKEGIVGLAILKIEENIEIDTFLLSCRILKRGVEDKLLQYIEEFAKKLNKKVVGYYFETPKNIQTKNFYVEHNYKKINQNTFIKGENYGKVN